MKKLTLLLTIIAILSTSAAAYAERVRGYVRQDGTRVESYQRSNRNSTAADNWSTKGNTNPYTGKRGTKKAW